jgi:sigma-E factor negative regulatory protein RseA
MKQEISALMDGELFEDESDSLLGRVKRDSATRDDWEVYHLIGDVLRQPEHIHCGLSAKVRARMQEEPTVLAPRGRTAKHKIHTMAWSAAASLAAVGVVAWMSMQITPETSPQLALQQTALRPASAGIKNKTNEYLMAHQEFSPSTGMNSGAYYIRTAAYQPGEK